MHTSKFDYLVMELMVKMVSYDEIFIKNNFTVLAVTRRKFNLLDNLKNI